ncbi:MAG: LysM peptidoglycan-binding domain-containing M23 family metallopeptidase [Elusimicrobia bacterium]|nr:LysM peptidoglycan-binding domain-containing M23 family metallopeptidase [Elusimicrobiota bacterium]
MSGYKLKKTVFMVEQSIKIFITLFLIFILCANTEIVDAQRIAPKSVQPQQVDRAKLLVNNLEMRLAHLQKRVTGAGFFIKKVKMRENLWKIARKRGYSVHSILGCNPQMETYDVHINERILLPSRGGTLHQIQKGDTWKKIAEQYDIEENELIKFNGNVGKLNSGEFIFVPGRMPDIDLMNQKLRAKYELREMFVSPLGGRLSSPFGRRRHPVTGKPSFHGGIDIAVREGTWVGAAADGVVTFAGNDGGHYGKAVFIRHQNGYETQYGHLSKIYVKVGQRVNARKLIARSGSTGRSTGPHLHFTIKRNGKLVDPLKFLW